MAAPCFGHCLCGAIRYRVNAEPQPWAVLPEGARRYEKSPADPMEYGQPLAHPRPPRES